MWELLLNKIQSKIACANPWIRTSAAHGLANVEFQCYSVVSVMAHHIHLYQIFCSYVLTPRVVTMQVTATVHFLLLQPIHPNLQSDHRFFQTPTNFSSLLPGAAPINQKRLTRHLSIKKEGVRLYSGLSGVASPKSEYSSSNVAVTCCPGLAQDV